jgi:hypothetical protein
MEFWNLQTYFQHEMLKSTDNFLKIFFLILYRKTQIRHTGNAVTTTTL